ncbi:unnamed protein product [Prorocentrum cordatum]|uniref:Condensin complex subunit 2 n=1 Tax=Prorocentrum cordatum TaxID=2364126 RepID=A0ABN9WYY3_9DINO|nr:unnamed protein product [Polarella glacialis]
MTSRSQFWGPLGPPPSPPPGNWDPPTVELNVDTLILAATAPVPGTIPKPPTPPQPRILPIKMLKRWVRKPSQQQEAKYEAKESEVNTYNPASRSAIKNFKRRRKYKMLMAIMCKTIVEEKNIPCPLLLPMSSGALGQHRFVPDQLAAAATGGDVDLAVGKAIFYNFADGASVPENKPIRPTIVKAEFAGFSADAETFIPGKPFFQDLDRGRVEEHDISREGQCGEDNGLMTMTPLAVTVPPPLHDRDPLRGQGRAHFEPQEGRFDPGLDDIYDNGGHVEPPTDVTHATSEPFDGVEDGSDIYDTGGHVEPPTDVTHATAVPFNGVDDKSEPEVIRTQIEESALTTIGAERLARLRKMGYFANAA